MLISLSLYQLSVVYVIFIKVKDLSQSYSFPPSAGERKIGGALGTWYWVFGTRKDKNDL